MKLDTIKYRDSWIMSALFFFALCIRILIISVNKFDGLYGQDAFAYLDYTKQIFSSHLSGPFYWPLGYPVLAALFTLLFRDPVMGAQAVNIILGAVLPVLIYLITGIAFEALNDKDTLSFKIIAALIAALSGQLIHSSIVIMSDVSALFWATLSIYALLQLNRSSKWIWLPLSLFALAFAIVTRWLYAGLLFPFAVYFLINHFSLLRKPIFFFSIPIFLLITVSQFIFSQHSSEPVLSHMWLKNWNALNALQTVFNNPDGHFQYHWPPFFFYAEPLFHPYYLFPLLTPFAFIGAWQLRRSPVLILLGGWILTFYFYLIGLPYENFRFGLAFFPPIIVLAALGLSGLPFSFHRLIWPFVAISLLAAIPFTNRGLTSLFDLKARELDSAAYLTNTLPPASTVITFGLTLTIEHYTSFKPVELYSQSPDTLEALINSTSRNMYVFVQLPNLETQWVGKTPLTNYYWLRDHVGLRELGTYQDWTLYSIIKK